MNRESYFEMVDNGLVDIGNISQFKRSWNRFAEYEKSNNFNLDVPHERQEYVAMFSSFGFKSQAAFRYSRMSLVLYLDFLCSKSLFPDAVANEVKNIMFYELQTTESERTMYYKSVNYLVECVQESLAEYGYSRFFQEEDADMGNPFLSSACFLILAWYGLSIEEILDVRIWDVKDGYVLVNGNEVVIPDETAMRLLNLYKRSKGVYRKNGKNDLYFNNYKFGSDYLFRTCKSDRFTPQSIKGRLYTLDTFMDGKFAFSHRTAYTSGIFNRAFKVECDSPKTFHPIENGEDFASLFGYKLPVLKSRRYIVEQYQNYKKIYH